jgi:hypothetical protein
MQDIEIRRVLRMHGLGQVGLAVEERGAVERREQPLVGIDNARVSPLEADELVAHARGEQCCTPVGAIDVEPQVSLGCHLGHPSQVVDDASIGGASRSHYGDDIVGIGVLRQRGAQPVTGQPVIGCGHHQRVDTDDVERLADR